MRKNVPDSDHILALYIMCNLMKKYLTKIHRYPNHLDQMSVWGTHLKQVSIKGDHLWENNHLKSVGSWRGEGGVLI